MGRKVSQPPRIGSIGGFPAVAVASTRRRKAVSGCSTGVVAPVVRPYYSAAGDVVTAIRRRRHDVIVTTTAICDALRAHDGVALSLEEFPPRHVPLIGGAGARMPSRTESDRDRSRRHDGALARSSAELTSHPENCGLTELAATPLARTTYPLCQPLLFYSTILPLCQPSRDYTLRLPPFRPEHPIPSRRDAPFTSLLSPPTLSRQSPSLSPSLPPRYYPSRVSLLPVGRKRLDQIRCATSRSDFALPTTPRSGA